MKTKGILWDNDGVLVDTEGLFYAANRELFARFDIALTHQHFFDWYLCDNIGAWHLLLERGLDQNQIAALRSDRNERYSELLQCEKNLAIVGIENVLQTLAPHNRMGIVTSSRHDHFHMIHGQLDLLKHFEFVVTEEDYVNSKPAPDPYLLGLAKLNLAAEQCLVVEDSPRGLQAALAAGLRCVVVRNEMSRHYDFKGAYAVVDGVEELLSVIA
ncbi:MAG: HAD family phosphatase [Undibacterium sp.]|nr:HAD family phosphatase [Undibacterium sp.]